MIIGIEHIEFYLPNKQVSNSDLQKIHPSWDVEKVGEKSGVYNRHIAIDGETAYDLACGAIDKLLINNKINLSDIDGIIFCTQSPDYIMPSNAFLVHKKYNFNHRVWAFDYNLACSGYVYGISIARGMIMSGMAKKVLLINADTYSKYIHPDDRSTSVLFGDGAAVSIISNSSSSEGIIDISLASSGEEYDSFYIPAGASRMPLSNKTKELLVDHSGNHRTAENIHMNGFAVWKFISRTVPDQINDILQKNNLVASDIKLFVFHQASKLTLDSLVKSLKIDPNKVYLNLDKVGNTVSASIPIALKFAEDDGNLSKGDLILISGFGVGLSWGSIILKY
jgi:3-oxoacyl-[acyl-carrier-protein] synthase-3